jgi:c-di-GMP-binding flagellar brake protein YcgR
VEFDEHQLIRPEVERRRYRRVKMVTQVHCEATDRHEIMVTRDVSLGGMFINVKLPLPLDSELSLTFRLSPAVPAIACRAKVMFSQVGLGMGIKFLEMSQDAQQALKKFVDEVA